MAQHLRYSRLAGGRIRGRSRSRPRGRSRGGSQDGASLWVRLWEAPWESLAVLIAFAAMTYVASVVLSQGMLDGLMPQQAGSQPVAAHFAECSGPARVTCVVDGDTFWLNGTKIRIADIDTPEISRPSCSHELMLGQRATSRLLDLLNAGPFDLIAYERDKDVYGRSLRIVSRNGQSLGDVLVREGLAHVWDGRKHSWCG